LPDISELNGTAIDNVAEFDGLTVSGVAPVPFTGLLDTYTGAAAGYSTRKLKTGVTVAARLRRSGDNIEADVEFDSNNEISLTSPISNASSGTYTDLADFVDHASTPRDAFVKEWKDQSGSGNHATQTTTTSQPQLYDATTGLITEDGKPAVDFTRTSSTVGHYLDVAAYQWQDSNGLMTIFGVWRTDGTTSGQIWSDNKGGSTRSFQYTAGNYFSMTTITGSTPGSYDTSSNPVLVNDAQHLCTGIVTNGTVEQNVDGTQTDNVSTVVNASVGSFDARMGARPSTNIEQLWDGRLQELIHYPSAQTGTNITGIEQNINSEYLIYQPTDEPTSGLLYDYGSATGGTDAAAAYSVRQLSDKAVICMRIRRDMGAGNPGDDDEINIGFDANGDLDTQAIADFCTTGTGWVTRWWDQSVNGNHADQPVGGTGSNTSQPQIYNGTAVLTLNGKPYVNFVRDGSSGTSLLTPSTSWSTAGELEFFAVFQNNSGVGNQETFSNASVRFFTGNATPHVNTAAGNLTYTLSKIANQNLFVYEHNSTARTVYIDGTQDATSASPANVSTTSSIAAIGRRYNGNEGHASVGFQELIHYPVNQSTNRTGIETDIDTYYQIPGM